MGTDAHTSLSLAIGQEHDVSEWEKAAAAVLRKAGRMTADDPDDAVWARLTRSTLDGIGITPLGTPALVADLPDPVRPPARGDGWDVRALLADPDAQASNAAALTDLENGVGSLWVQLGASGIDVLRPAHRPEGRAPRHRPGRAGRAVGPARCGAGVRCARGGADPRPGTNLGVDPVGAQVRGVVATSQTATCSTRGGAAGAGARLPGPGRRRDRRARPRCLRRAGARLRAGARRALPARAGRGRGPGRRGRRTDRVPARGQ